ncbi:response regulator transcription factor [Aestuariispira insulae]|uniref:Response regulator receiver domain-containing protein n=1 Tax=Aestuariispira insulae TaxID=1461337 RepID=A0A3D9HS06_9PROT|nr:response regulator [Aestuariispira insulae]RED52250.1 response regulator receiver domain-containing protein [Aestuariispira insulae]
MAVKRHMGKNDNAKKVVVYYAESKSDLRLTMRNTLAREGFESTLDFGSLADLWAAVQSRAPDLVLVDAEMVTAEADGAKFMRDIRYGRLGDNPYIPIICTVWNSELDYIRRLIDAGPDDLLVKPFSPKDLFDRIEALVSRRKPFVVTSDYIGPDRRKDTVREDDDNLIEVPNTLSDKMAGRPVNAAQLQRAIRGINAEINEMKLRRNAFQISFLVELLLPQLEQREPLTDAQEQLRHLRQVARDTTARMDGTRYSHVADLAQSLQEIARSLEETVDLPDVKDIKLLKRLSQAILLAFNPGTDAEALAGEISSAVSKYDAKQKAKKKAGKAE